MSKKEKYEELSVKVLELVGGKDNISYFGHCMTRLRFELKDKSAVDLSQIQKIEGVVGAQWSNEQLQIIIGQSVGEVYGLVAAKAGLEKEKAIEENLDGKKKKFSIGAIIDGITGSLMPLIPAIIGAGMLKVIIILCELAGVLTPEMPTHAVLTFAADAGFYFLPVFLGATAANKFKANMGLGMLLGAIMIHPTMVANVAGAVSMSIFGVPVYAANYSSTIFPVIMAVFVMSHVEKFFKKIAPDSIKAIVVPLGTILVMLPLTLGLIGPAGAFLGNYLAAAIMWLYNTTGFFGVAVLATVYPLLILTGMHGALFPYMFQSLVSFGYEPIVATANVLSNINQGAAAAAVAFKCKDKATKSTAGSSAITAVFGGVTEPAMFGINMKLKKPLYAAMFGNFCSAAFAGLMKVYMYSLGGSAGILGIAGFVGPTSSNFIFMIISILIGIVVTFITTLFLYKGESIYQ
ncbi:PTS transporter subunit EIIC [Candidatus Galacturonibacter soehngenii]|uniref:PTS beta-glucoside transporter subunit IIABC n=1 Tax=Candidatus Galacturonatibacter soehngenii TaxID=2307010 RepID=A0A7V7QJ55_9FIRM|nr:PTS transporter subunit EIIC [Candidatus Galacturonibacter soehngenii]KAB1436021.1 PTS beta-glucoside transporter subunit IIABC [Candidatus Galacturonibacter soehngenii]